MDAMTLLALVAGVVVGVVLGLLGGGGAIIAVPVLVFALGQSPHHATAGSLVIVGISAVVAAITHARAGRVRWGQGVLFGLLGMGGAVLGSKLAIGVSGRLLLLVFSGLLVVVAALMWRRAGSAEPGLASHEHLDIITIRPTFHVDLPRAVRVVLAAAAVGLLTGFFGVGGGFAAVPALVLALDFPMPAAVGTSLLVIAINSASALTTRLLEGVTPDWRVVIPFTAAAMIGSLAGARFSARIPPGLLKRAFAVMLVIVAVVTVVGALAGD